MALTIPDMMLARLDPLANWVRSSKIVLESNPEYRGFVWDFQPTEDPEDLRWIPAREHEPHSDF